MTFQFPGFQHRIHLDFETYSELDIRKTGAHAYAQHPSTEVLMLGYAIDDGPEYMWIPSEDGEMPDALKQWLLYPAAAKTAFNAAFERLILKHVLNMDIPAEQWRCSMVAAYYLGFTGGLDLVAKQMGLSEQKDDRGARLIMKFSKPAPSNHKADRYDRHTSPEEWAEFVEYCRQDVRTERALLHSIAKFPLMNEWDWDRYALDQKINDRGVYVDLAMSEGAIRLWDNEKERLTQELIQLTGLPKVTRGPFTTWLGNELGFTVTSLTKENLDSLRPVAAPHIIKAIDLWQEKEGKAVAKYQAVINGACEDSRARGLFQFKGASRTDRTAGRRIQLQNLKRSFEEDVPTIGEIVSSIRESSPAKLKLLSGRSVSEALGGSVRHVLQAPEGKILVQADLSSIESVVLGWLTYCDSILDTFRHGRDTYKEFAWRYYGITYEEVTRDMRNFSKPPVLGCGYMLGRHGLIAYAEGFGVSLTEEEAKRAVDTFRGMYPEIPKFWTWINDAVKYVTQTGESLGGYRLHIERDEEMLRIWLPSGRALSYYKPDVTTAPAPWSEPVPRYGGTTEDLKAQYPHMSNQELVDAGLAEHSAWVHNFSYMGMDTNPPVWRRLRAHAGLLTENIVQSIAMDILFDGMTRAEAAGIPIVSQVHDELVGEVPELEAIRASELLKQCMTQLPDWAPDLWLGADGYISKYYKKD